jgi:hypothetical protein
METNSNTALWLSHFMHYYDEQEYDNLSTCIPYLDFSKLLPSSKSSIFLPKDPLERIHYSWLAETIQNLEEEQQQLFSSCLSKNTSSSLHSYLKLSEIPSHYPEWFKNIVLEQLRNIAVPKDLCPIELLPQTPMSFLSNYSKQQLVVCISLLGIADLASELKKVLNSKVLSYTRKFLSPRQAHYFEFCLRAKQRLALKEPKLLPFINTPSKLPKALHLKGLQRFSLALQGENKSFIWYITRLLDKGRGMLINNQIPEKNPQKVVLCIQQQLHDIHKTYLNR